GPRRAAALFSAKYRWTASRGGASSGAPHPHSTSRTPRTARPAPRRGAASATAVVDLRTGRNGRVVRIVQPALGKHHLRRRSLPAARPFGVLRERGGVVELGEQIVQFGQTGDQSELVPELRPHREPP